MSSFCFSTISWMLQINERDPLQCEISVQVLSPAPAKCKCTHLNTYKCTINILKMHWKTMPFYRSLQELLGKRMADKDKPEEQFPSPTQECPLFCSQFQTSRLPLPGHTESSSVCLPTLVQHLLSSHFLHQHLTTTHAHTNMYIYIHTSRPTQRVRGGFPQKSLKAKSVFKCLILRGMVFS